MPKSIRITPPKTANILIRLSPAEKKEIKETALAVGAESVSAYLLNLHRRAK